MKKSGRKLSVRSETLRVLERRELKVAQGGDADVAMQLISSTTNTQSGVECARQ